MRFMTVLSLLLMPSVLKPNGRSAVAIDIVSVLLLRFAVLQQNSETGFEFEQA